MFGADEPPRWGDFLSMKSIDNGFSDPNRSFGPFLLALCTHRADFDAKGGILGLGRW